MERRSFLVRLTVALGGLLAGVLAVPGLAMLAAPLTRRTTRQGFIRLKALRDLPEGRPVRVPVRQTVVDAWTRYPQRPVGSAWLLRIDAEHVQARSNICPHAGCNLDFDDATKRFTCPCHEAIFTGAGEPIEGPAKRGMDPLEVKVEDGYVWVRWERFRLGIAERVAR